MSAMGAQAFSQMQAQTPVESDPKLNEYVRCIAVPISQEASGPAGITEWDIKVFKDETANAFALPGGKIGVHTGILKVAKTPDQLAAVIGHEVGHVIAKHGAERVSQSLATQLGETAIGAATGNHPAVMAAMGLGAQVGLLLPFSRTQESEADLIGLDLMARSGFNPRESVELWKNMSAQAKGAPPEFLSTHPSDAKRMDALNAHMSEAIPKYDQARGAGKNPKCVPPR